MLSNTPFDYFSFYPLATSNDFFQRLHGFRSPVVLSHSRREEADDPELIVSQGDHDGRIVFMWLPVNVFQKI